VMHHEGLLAVLIKREVVDRMTSPALRRNAEWYKPLTIYFPVMFGGALPWSLLALRAALRAVPAILTRAWWRDRLANNPWLPFLILWLALPLAVFCLSRSRMPLYPLPLFVPVALIVARVAPVALLARRTTRWLAVWLALLVLFKGASAFFPYSKVSRPFARAIAGQVTPCPPRIAFVGLRPLWGLSLYLGSEILNVKWGEGMSSADRQAGLRQALAAPRPPTLLIAHRVQARKVLADLADIGFHAGELMRLQAWHLLTVNDEFVRVEQEDTTDELL